MNNPEARRTWTSEERTLLDRTPLIGVATERTDGSLADPVPIGHVRVGVDELIRSLHGTEGAWYQRAVRSGRGAIDVAGRRIPVTFEQAAGQDQDFDDALRARYGDDSGTRQMTEPAARTATLRMVPASAGGIAALVSAPPAGHALRFG